MIKNIQKISEIIKNNKISAVVIICFFVFLFNFRIIIINGCSMDSTLKHNQLHIGTYHIDNIKNGDIIVANSKYLNEQIIKRVIASPGDTIEIKNNIVYVNDIQINEPYLNEKMITEDIKKFKLANNEYFVMGDNRKFSYDSRNIGCITYNEIYMKFVI